MADVKISGRTAATAATLTQEIPIVQGGTTKRATVQLFQNLLGVYRGVLSSPHTISSTTATEAFSANSLPAGTYWYEVRLMALTAAASGTGVAPKFGVNFTNTYSTEAHCLYLPTTGTISAGGTWDEVGATSGQTWCSVPHSGFQTTAASIMLSGGVSSTDSYRIGLINGMFIATLTGDFEIWHGSETATETTLGAGSSVILWKVA